MARIIIGVDERDNAQDAIAFGGALARDSGAGVMVVHAYQWQHAGSVEITEANRLLLAESDGMLARRVEALSDLPDLDMRSLPEPSAARALQEVSDELDGMVDRRRRPPGRPLSAATTGSRSGLARRS